VAKMGARMGKTKEVGTRGNETREDRLTGDRTSTSENLRSWGQGFLGSDEVTTCKAGQSSKRRNKQRSGGKKVQKRNKVCEDSSMTIGGGTGKGGQFEVRSD